MRAGWSDRDIGVTCSSSPFCPTGRLEGSSMLDGGGLARRRLGFVMSSPAAVLSPSLCSEPTTPEYMPMIDANVAATFVSPRSRASSCAISSNCTRSEVRLGATWSVNNTMPWKVG